MSCSAGVNSVYSRVTTSSSSVSSSIPVITPLDVPSGYHGLQPLSPLIYRLPGTETSQKSHIVDPFMLYTEYELPTRQVPFIPEIVEPLQSDRIIPIIVPPPTEDKPLIEKLANPWLMRIRHKKMKKHQLRKLRKRMRFVYRKRRLLKAKRKEKEIVVIENKFIKLAKDFDANVFVDENIAAAKRGSWGIDVLAERHKKKMSQKPCDVDST